MKCNAHICCLYFITSNPGILQAAPAQPTWGGIEWRGRSRRSGIEKSCQYEIERRGEIEQNDAEKTRGSHKASVAWQVPSTDRLTTTLKALVYCLDGSMRKLATAAAARPASFLSR
jgi:hypothetical protein